MDEPTNPTPTPTASRLRSVTGWARRNWGTLVAVIVPVVTVTTIVIPLVADASVRLSSVETLSLGSDAEPEAEAVIAAAASVGLGSDVIVGESVAEQMPDRGWLVRSDAPFETLPLGEGERQQGLCLTVEQTAWLEEWGHRDLEDVWNGYLTLTNTATDGAAMSVRNIRSVGSFTDPEVPEVRVECGGGIGAGSEIIPLTQLLGSDDPAVLAGEYDGMPPGSPAVLNLSPGEFVQLALWFDREDAKRSSHFAGSLYADVTVGDETTEVVLYDGFTRSGQPAITTTTLRIDRDGLYCGPDGGWDSCTIPLFLEQLRSDPGYRG